MSNQNFKEVGMYLDKLYDQYRYRSLSGGRQALLVAVFALALLAVTAISTEAQSFTGSISGTITDPAGAVIPNATVTLTAVDTGRTRTATTNSAGEYNFASLPPGAYKIRVEAKSFSSGEL